MIKIHDIKIRLIINREDINLIPEDNFEYLDFPIYVDRIENESTIVWFGIKTNFEYDKEQGYWYKYPGEIVCTIPTYEIIYLNLIK